ncbi:hypothetical protein HBI53_149290 [Parastagonospora nodorum]|nr:hypothetical protein HBI53_149290 [Parastagonospora nodorum]
MLLLQEYNYLFVNSSRCTICIFKDNLDVKKLLSKTSRKRSALLTPIKLSLKKVKKEVKRSSKKGKIKGKAVKDKSKDAKLVNTTNIAALKTALTALKEAKVALNSLIATVSAALINQII